MLSLAESAVEKGDDAAGRHIEAKERHGEEGVPVIVPERDALGYAHRPPEIFTGRSRDAPVVAGVDVENGPRVDPAGNQHRVNDRQRCLDNTLELLGVPPEGRRRVLTNFALPSLTGREDLVQMAARQHEDASGQTWVATHDQAADDAADREPDDPDPAR
ncbi:MAG TPA: hypothetical protein VLZ10_06040, partial [Thermodesulfobacteriota bacterium]|nr:hypothetical protein [Thermodesulfobacteriota bacterium]